jgi:hypothetical protein
MVWRERVANRCRFGDGRFRARSEHGPQNEPEHERSSQCVWGDAEAQ